MIVSVRDARIHELLEGRAPRRFPPNIVRSAQRRLNALVLAERLEDLQFPPSNRLELLRGDRAGQYSIRINNQWRICFVWKDDGAHDVEIVDYH